MCSLQAELHQMGSQTNNEDFSNMIISSLPPSWDSFTASYLGAQMGKVTTMSQELIAVIRDEYN